MELEGTVDNLDELQERVQEEVEDEVWSEMEQLKKKDKSKTVLGDRA